MLFLYASERPYLPERLDGAIYAVHCLFSMLRRRGHQCEALVPGLRTGTKGWSVYRAARWITRRRLLALPDYRNGYRTARARPELFRDALRRRLADRRPDVLLTQLEGTEAIATEAVRAGIPAVVWVHDNEFGFYAGRPPVGPGLLAVSATDYVGDRVREKLGMEAPVLYPPVDLGRCRARREHPDLITMINPYPVKGVHIALKVAELLPHRRFQLVETWPLHDSLRAELDAAVARLPNVTLRPGSPRIAEVYDRTLLLLAPSQWVEAFCTVILEANVNGIPAVASRIGGIPTTLGGGGVLVEPDAPPEEWARRVEDVLSDPAKYEALSRAARANATRPEFDPDRIAIRFLELVSGMAAPGTVSRAPVPSAARD